MNNPVLFSHAMTNYYVSRKKVFRRGGGWNSNVELLRKVHCHCPDSSSFNLNMSTQINATFIPIPKQPYDENLRRSVGVAPRIPKFVLLLGENLRQQLNRDWVGARLSLGIRTDKVPSPAVNQTANIQSLNSYYLTLIDRLILKSILYFLYKLRRMFMM